MSTKVKRGFSNQSKRYISRKQNVTVVTLCKLWITCLALNHSVTVTVTFFLICPLHKKLVREKLLNYILGLATSRLLKWRELLLLNQWWSGDPQILHSRISCGKGTAKSKTKKFEAKSLQFIQKRQILDGETLTHATRSDVERELCRYNLKQIRFMIIPNRNKWISFW